MTTTPAVVIGGLVALVMALIVSALSFTVRDRLYQPDVVVKSSCDHNNRVYVFEHYRQGGIAVVANDPSCRGI